MSFRNRTTGKMCTDVSPADIGDRFVADEQESTEIQTPTPCDTSPLAAPASQASMQELTVACQLLLTQLGLPLQDENFRETPSRLAKALVGFCTGYEPVEQALTDFAYSNEANSMVALKDITVSALCPHHLFPWLGVVAIGYIPHKRVLGLSKLPRLVYAASHVMPMMQEEFTDLVADLISTRMEPRGVIVRVAAKHTCMACRGVEQPQTLTVTQAIRGVYRDVPAARTEFADLVR